MQFDEQSVEWSVKGLIGAPFDQGNTATATQLLQGQTMCGDFFDVSPAQRARLGGDQAIAFKAFEAADRGHFQIQFVGVKQPENTQIMAPMHQAINGGAQFIGRRHGVGDQHHQTAARRWGGQMFDTFGGIGASLGLMRFEQMTDAFELTLPGTFDFGDRVLGEDQQADPIILIENQAGQGGGDNAGVMPFADRGTITLVRHAAGAIDRQQTGEIGFGLIPFQHQAIGSAQDFPVEMAQIIAGDIRPVVGKIDAVALMGAAMTAGVQAFDDASGGDFQVVQPGERFGSNQVGSHDGWECRSGTRAENMQSAASSNACGLCVRSLLAVLAKGWDWARLQDMSVRTYPDGTAEVRELRQRLEALARFSTAIAHDFNNQLTTILGYTEVLARGQGPSDGLGFIRSAAERSADFTHKLTTVGRPKRALMRDLHLAQVLRDAEPTLRQMLPVEVALRVETPADPIPFQSDRTQLEQILHSLVANAGESHARTVVVRGQSAGVENLTILVEDDGCGIAAEELPRCFEPMCGSKQSKGAGFGLTEATLSLYRLGGCLTVTSAVGTGTTVTITLPRAS